VTAPRQTMLSTVWHLSMTVKHPSDEVEVISKSQAMMGQWARAARRPSCRPLVIPSSSHSPPAAAGSRFCPCLLHQWTSIQKCCRRSDHPKDRSLWIRPFAAACRETWTPSRIRTIPWLCRRLQATKTGHGARPQMQNIAKSANSAKGQGKLTETSVEPVGALGRRLEPSKKAWGV
jgi:hypothetical protein